MKRLIIDCSDEMAQLIQKLAANGEIKLRGEADIPMRTESGREFSDYFGINPPEEREGWRQYAATLGKPE